MLPCLRNDRILHLRLGWRHLFNAFKRFQFDGWCLPFDDLTMVLDGIVVEEAII